MGKPGRGRRGAAGPPRSLADALQAVRAEVAPTTLLAAVQESWPQVAGPLAAAQGDPVTEREGVVTIACRSATWAQELDLMQPELVARLAERLESGPFESSLRGLRFSADAARSDSA